MRKRCSKGSLVFVVIVMVSVMISNLAYADSTLPQSNKDVPSNWAIAEIGKAKEAGILPEKLMGNYENDINREEFCEIAVNLYEALSGKEGTLQKENPFTDTQNTQVTIAYNLGIVNGKSAGRFAPDEEITREEISVMLYRTLRAAKPAYNYPSLNNYVFSDYDRISTWARDAVGYLYGIGVINGVGNNRFKPEGYTSREEAIVLAERIHNKVLTSANNLTVSRGDTNRRESVLKSKLEGLIAQEMGKPYQWGATGPDSYDCSGLVYYLYGKLGIALPRTSSSQAGAGIYVPKEKLEYGDLVFFARDGKNVNHVGIYVGNGMMVNAPQTGDVVKITTIVSGYYERTYYTARRVVY